MNTQVQTQIQEDSQGEKLRHHIATSDHKTYVHNKAEDGSTELKPTC